MCGRYLLTSPIEALRRVFSFVGAPINLRPRFNIAPTQEAPIVRLEDGERRLRMLRWGLVPSWAKDLSIGSRMINARAESVAEKPGFRAAYRARRCLVPADGFYEWPEEQTASPRLPVLVRHRAGPFAFAGLFEHWTTPGTSEVVETFTFVTTDANAALAPYHHRMPVILDPADHAAWLDASRDARALLRPPPAEGFSVEYVSSRVNNVRNDDEACLQPAAPKAVARQGSLL